MAMVGIRIMIQVCSSLVRETSDVIKHRQAECKSGFA